MTDKINIVFYPTIESHFESFLPVILKIIENEPELNPILLYFSTLISRKFLPDNHLPSKYIYKIHDTWDSIEKQIVNDVFTRKNGILVVGNDAGRYTKKLINVAKRKNNKTILLQDGWLEHMNINKPIRFESNFIKYYLKYILAHNLSPLKSFFGGFIGQSADYAFVYSEFAKNEFIKAGVSSKKVIVTGSPRHQMMKIKSSSKKVDVNKLIFAFFSTIPGSEADEKEILKFFEKIEIFLNTYNESFKLLIKDHPRENGRRFERFLNEQVEFYNKPTKDLLEDYHIEVAFSFNSTVIIELLLNKVPVIQLLPKTRSIDDSGYFKNLFHINSEDNLNEVFKNKNYLNKTLDDYYLADFSENHNSVNKVITCIKQIVTENKSN